MARGHHDNWRAVNAILEDESDLESSNYASSDGSEVEDRKSLVSPKRKSLSRRQTNPECVPNIRKRYMPVVVIEVITLILTVAMAIHVCTFQSPGEHAVSAFMNSDDMTWYPILAVVVAAVSITLPPILIKSQYGECVGWGVIAKLVCAGLFIGTFIYETSQPYSASLWGVAQFGADVLGADRGRARVGWMITLGVLQIIEAGYLYFGLYVMRKELYGEREAWYDRDGLDSRKRKSTSTRKKKKAFRKSRNSSGLKKNYGGIAVESAPVYTMYGERHYAPIGGVVERHYAPMGGVRMV